MSFVDIEDGKFRLPVSTGLISALVFVLLDLVFLTTLDLLLSRLLCTLYYRDIDIGRPIRVRSTNVLGVTNFQIGRYFQLPNILALITKLFCLGCVLVLDLSISSEVRYSDHLVSSNSIFTFNASKSDYSYSSGSYLHRKVEDQFEAVRSCYSVKGEAITYYAVAFNSTDDGTKSIGDDNKETRASTHFDSFRCLSPRNLRNKSDAISIAKVIGCSKAFGNESCSTAVYHRFTRVLPNEGANNISLRSSPENFINITYLEWSYGENDSRLIFPEYKDNRPHITCLQTSVGTEEVSKKFSTCLLTVELDNGFLVEKWNLNRTPNSQYTDLGEFSRRFAGPIFHTKMSVGFETMMFMTSQFEVDTNWLTFSSNLIGTASVPQKINYRFNFRENTGTVATLPVVYVTLAATLSCIVLVAWFVSLCTIAKDRRPVLNSLDGLSAIIQMGLEKNSRGGQLRPYSTLGVSLRNGKPHFGPLYDGEENLPREKINFK